MRKAVVVDLDGTLLSTNTFKDYISFVAKKAFASFRLDICFLLTLCVFLRKVRFVTHENMKKHILLKSQSFFEKLSLEFVDLISAKINDKVLQAVNEYRSVGYVLILSTAAPNVYASLIGEKYNFNHVISTPDVGVSDWHENVKTVKMKNTMSFLSRLNYSLSVFITDHYDDIPLLSIEKDLNLLVDPTSKSLNEIEDAEVKYSIL